MSNAVARGQISFHQAEKGEDTFYLRLSPSLLAMSNKRTADDISHQREWWRKYQTSLRLMRGDTNVSGAISRVRIYNESGALVFDSSLDHQTSTADITFSGLYNQATDATTGADKSAWILSFMKFDTPAPCEGQFQIYVDASIPAEEGSTARIPFFDYITLTYTVEDLDTLWGLEYLREATSNGTVTQEGGLILSNAIALGEWENDTFIPWAGMSGIYDDGYVFQGETLPGKSIAAWYGGDMIDYENLTAAERETERYAQSLFRMDGSGYLAGGGISWDDDGNLVIAGGVKMTDSQGRQVSVGSVTDLSGLFELKNVGTEQNPVWAIHALNNYPIYSDSWISALGAGSGSSGGGGGGADLPAVWESLSKNESPYANQKIDPHHLNIPVSQGSGTYVTGVSWDTTAGILYVTRAAKPSYAFSEITGTATASQLPNIESLTNFSTRVYDATVSRTKNHVLAAPSNANGAATFRALVASDIPDLSSTYQTKYGFTISGTAGKTYNLANFLTSIPLAANGTRGGIQIGFTQSGKNYPVQLSSEKAYVNVPWTDTTYTNGTGLALNGTTFSINSTYQGYISNGNTAYGWGNHANAGYLLASTAASTYLDLDHAIKVSWTESDLTDVNTPDQKTSAIYYARPDVATIANWPSSLASYGLFADLVSAATHLQFIGGSGTNNILARSYFWTKNPKGFTYPGWVRLWHSGNFTPSDYLPLTGGTMTGAITSNSQIYTSSTMRARYLLFLNADGTDNAGYIGRGGSNNDLAFTNYGANSLIFATNGSQRMTIDSAGNVGIGADASSSYKLYVSGAVHFTGATSIANTLKLSGTSKRIYFGDTYYIELDSNNQLHTNAPFYSDSWVSALGAGSGSGGGGGSTDLSSVWASLSGHTDAYKSTTIDWAHIKVNRSDSGSGNVVSEVALTPANDGKSATLTITKTNIAGYSWVYEKDVTTTIS